MKVDKVDKKRVKDNRIREVELPSPTATDYYHTVSHQMIALVGSDMGKELQDG
jgi:hypothetical protein